MDRLYQFPLIDKCSKLYVSDSKGKQTAINILQGPYEIGNIEAYIPQVFDMKKDEEFWNPITISVKLIAIPIQLSWQY